MDLTNSVTVDVTGPARAIANYQADFQFSAATFTGPIDKIFTTLGSYIDGVQSTVAFLNNVLPLLDPGAQASIAKLVGLVSTFDQLTQQAKARVAGLLSSTLTLTQIVAALTTIPLLSPASNVGITFTAGFTTTGSTVV